MNGTVLGRQPMVPVVIRLPGQPDFTIDFVVDTGYEGSLTLPLTAIMALGLSFDQQIIANFADNRHSLVDAYVATIVWHGAELDVPVLATGKRPLLGTMLLDGNDLAVRFADGGSVIINKF